MRRSVKVVISCHVEFGYAANSVVFDRQERKGALEGLECCIRIAKEFDARVSLMIMPEVVETIKGLDLGDNGIGLHIHPEDSHLRKRSLGGFRALRDYDFLEQKAMISAGKEIIDEIVGVTPKSFVAGKWSVDNNTVRALVELGFSHDCSPCPGFASVNCDWRKLPRMCMPYKVSHLDYQSSGTMNLVMVPVSKEIIGGVISPENRIGLAFLKAAFQEYYDSGCPVVHIALHSPSMTSRHYRKLFNKLLKHISKHNVTFCLAEDIETAESRVPPRARLLPYIRNLDAEALSYLAGNAFRRLVQRRYRWSKGEMSFRPIMTPQDTTIVQDIQDSYIHRSWRSFIAKKVQARSRGAPVLDAGCGTCEHAKSAALA